MKEYAFLLIFLLIAPAGFAQTPATDSAVEISAAGSLEWQRGEKAYIAKGSVTVVKDNMHLSCDKLTASYATDQASTSITVITAEGHVHFTAQGHEAFGDHAVYDLQTEIVTLTGKDLRLVTPEEIVTAKDKIVYIRPENRLNAVGYAKATKNGDAISADTLSAFFDEKGQNALELRKIEAENNVVITTATEKVFGSSGVWDAKTQKATLEGPVQIEQGQSHLTGDKVVVDMKTGLSQLFAGADEQGGNGRVKGVFYPHKKELKK